MKTSPYHDMYLVKATHFDKQYITQLNEATRSLTSTLSFAHAIACIIIMEVMVKRNRLKQRLGLQHRKDKGYCAYIPKIEQYRWHLVGESRDTYEV